jgi:hypothetical protein
MSTKRAKTLSAGVTTTVSPQTIDCLVEWYDIAFYRYLVFLHDEIRRRLRDDSGVLPEFLDIEVKRVMARTLSR